MLRRCSYAKSVLGADAFSWEWLSLQYAYSEHKDRLTRPFQNSETWVGGEYHLQSCPLIFGAISISLFWKVHIVLLQSLSVPGVSGHACALLVRHAEVCVPQILFCSFTQWDWLWPSLVLGLRIAEAGWVLRLLYFSAQSSRRLHLTLSLPTFLRTNYFVLCGFIFDCTVTDPVVAISVSDPSSWVSLFSQSWDLQAL